MQLHPSQPPNSSTFKLLGKLHLRSRPAGKVQFAARQSRRTCLCAAPWKRQTIHKRSTNTFKQQMASAQRPTGHSSSTQNESRSPIQHTQLVQFGCSAYNQFQYHLQLIVVTASACLQDTQLHTATFNQTSATHALPAASTPPARPKHAQHAAAYIITTWFRPELVCIMAYVAHRSTPLERHNTGTRATATLHALAMLQPGSPIITLQQAAFCFAVSRAQHPAPDPRQLQIHALCVSTSTNPPLRHVTRHHSQQIVKGFTCRTPSSGKPSRWTPAPPCRGRTPGSGR